MERLKLYLDTSVINFALAKDIPIADKEITEKLCGEINKHKFLGFISEVVLREIGNTNDSRRKQNLSKFIGSLKLEEVLKINNEVDNLAEKYIAEKIIPPSYRDDALHIALASVNRLDILVSWNFKHLVRHKTRLQVTGVNTLLGYKSIDICTPWEVIYDEDN